MYCTKSVYFLTVGHKNKTSHYMNLNNKKKNHNTFNIKKNIIFYSSNKYVLTSNIFK